MLFGLFGNKKTNDKELLNEYFTKLCNEYSEDKVSEKRKKFLSLKMLQYGYLPFSQIQALEELTDEEVLYALKEKLKRQEVLVNNKFKYNHLSPLKRHEIHNSNWIKDDRHDIKLVNLASLGNGNLNHEDVSFFDWLRQLVILPTGKNGVVSTTIYLIPFHPREFGCAYLPASSDVSEHLYDKKIGELLGINQDEQVQLFIKLAQLAGHPVIYDILPQTSRFSKMVLSNPNIARWVDVNELIEKIKTSVDEIKQELYNDFEQKDIDEVVNIYKDTLLSGSIDLSEDLQKIYDKLDNKLKDIKIKLSREMSEKTQQKVLQKRIKEIIAQTHGIKKFQFKTEQDIKKQGECIQNLIKTGLWPMPGGAWCSCNVPVFNKMAENGEYPEFKHYDYNGKDVTEFANLDCQTPFYFVNFENGEPNYDVVEFFIQNLVNLQKKYNFDGFRVDHIDHIVDEISQQNGVAISYRAPAFVLAQLSKIMKKKIPHFVMLAEYMLWDKFYKEYHEDMGFDLLWGNDIIMQSSKNPLQIIDDNRELAEYNSTLKNNNYLSVIRTYNNQDGEFEAINQYPGQLGEQGALFKWFKYKFIPAGELAQRPCMYIDGDESCTKVGIERTIGAEVAMIREKNYDFFSKFNSINTYAMNCDILRGGEAQIFDFDNAGYASWLISKDPLKQHLLVVSNYLAPTEPYDPNNKFGIKEGNVIENKTINLPCDFRILSEIKFDDHNELSEFPIKDNVATLTFDRLNPSEFKIYKLIKK